MLALAAALDARGGGAVVAGPAGSADERGTVAALAADEALAAEVSSVDNADRGTGRVSLVLALAEQRRGGAGRVRHRRRRLDGAAEPPLRRDRPAPRSAAGAARRLARDRRLARSLAARPPGGAGALAADQPPRRAR